MSITTAFQGKRFRVDQHQVADRDGVTRQYDIIRHPGSGVILPLLPDDQVVFIRNWRLAIDDYILELPAGTLEPDEDPLDCARRELKEETGYAAETIEPLVDFWPSPGICDERMKVFLARGLRAGETRHEPGERITVLSMPFEQALVAIEQRRIDDAKTLIALLLYARLRSNGGPGGLV